MPIFLPKDRSLKFDLFTSIYYYNEQIEALNLTLTLGQKFEEPNIKFTTVIMIYTTTWLMIAPQYVPFSYLFSSALSIIGPYMLTTQ